MIVDGDDGGIKCQSADDSGETQSLLSAAGPSHQRAAGPPPPNYQAALESPLVLPGPGADEHESVLWVKQRERVDRRFFRALGVALLIYVAVASTVKIIYSVAQGNVIVSVPTTPTAKDGQVLQCYARSSGAHRRWNSSGVKLPSDHSSLPKYQSVLDLELPTDAASLYLLNKGSLAYGRVTLRTVPATDRSTVGVTIEARYYSKDVFDEADVCELARDSGERGIGIYTPSYAFGKFPADRQLEYRIEYRIPIQPPAVTHMRHFETDMPRFQHLLEDFGPNSVTFGHIGLHGSNGGIGVYTLTAETVSLKTSNAPIGVQSLRTNNSVEINTSNAPVELAVQLVNGDSLRPAKVAVHTVNGEIHLQSELIYYHDHPSGPDSPQPAGVAGAFDINASTSNARAEIAVTHAPVYAQLGLRARTSNAPLTVVLYPAFEGDVLLRASWSPSPPGVEISERVGPVDPRYRGRRYAATREGEGEGEGEGEWRGRLAWEPRARGVAWWGRVQLATSNARCVLAVPCVEANCLPVVRLGAG